MEDVIQSENEKMKNIHNCSVLDIQEYKGLNLDQSNQMIINIFLKSEQHFWVISKPNHHSKLSWSKVVIHLTGATNKIKKTSCFRLSFKVGYAKEKKSQHEYCVMS